VLEKYGGEMIGANAEAIEKAEDRLKFKNAMDVIGLESAKSGVAHSMDEAWAVQKDIADHTGGSGFPVVIRPSFTLGGSGGGIAYNAEEVETIGRRRLEDSPTRSLHSRQTMPGSKELRISGG